MIVFGAFAHRRMQWKTGCQVSSFTSTVLMFLQWLTKAA